MQRTPAKSNNMNDSQAEIMRWFRRFDVGVGQMLFFDTGPARTEPDDFQQAIATLIERGMVIQERPRGAYSLTKSGYLASLTA